MGDVCSISRSRGSRNLEWVAYMGPPLEIVFACYISILDPHFEI
jgi:hypothetical protein